MRSGALPRTVFNHLLAGMMPANALAIEVSLNYGMRIGDVLKLHVSDVEKGRFTYKEEKTGKARRITLSREMQTRLLAQSGRVWVFEHRLDWRKHRTRQAVYKDLKRIAKAFRLERGCSPHSARKTYSVERYKEFGGDLKRVQRLLNHSSEAVTMLYAMAADLTEKMKK